MTTKEYTELRITVLNLKKHKKGYLTYLTNKFTCSRAKALQIFEKLENGEQLDFVLAQEDVIKPDSEAGIIIGNGYTYNQLTDKYIVPLKTYGGNFVCPGDQHRAMLAGYSNWKGDEQSITKLANTYKMRREWVKEYLQIMDWTHDTPPITTEEILAGKHDEAIQRVLDTKRTSFHQELQQEDWKQTQADAEKWNLFEGGKLDPFARFIDAWEPKPYKPLTPPSNKNRSSDVLLIGLSDLHFGGKASEESLFKGSDFNSEKIRDIMRLYAEKIRDHLETLKVKFGSVAVCSLGDILHTLTGYTVKGTPITADVIGEEQFDLAMDCLLEFFQHLLKLFPKVSVYATKGNHAGVGDYILFKAIEAYFRKEKRMKFHLFKTRQACFRIGTTVIMMDHGASDVNKSVIPTSGSNKEAYIQSMFLNLPELLPGSKSRLMIQGDRHKFLCEEMRGFEHVILGSCVTGDPYADNLGLHSRARQNCLVLGEDGLKEIINFYFD